MTSIHDLGRRLAEHFRREAPPRAPDWLLESTLAIIETTPQRRRLLRLRERLHLPWRLPIMNTFAKLAVTAVALVVGGLALATVAGAPLLRIGETEPIVPSPSPTAPATPSPSLTPSPTAAATPTLVGTATLDEIGCSWDGPTGPLPAGPIVIRYVNATMVDLGMFGLFEVTPGHTYQELVDWIAAANLAAGAGQLAPDTPDGITNTTATNPTRDSGSLTPTVNAGTYGVVCVRGDANYTRPSHFDLIGPIELE